MPLASDDNPNPSLIGAQVQVPGQTSASPPSPPTSPNPLYPEPERDDDGNLAVTPSRPKASWELKLDKPLTLSRAAQESLKNASKGFSAKEQESTPFSNRIHKRVEPNPKRDEYKQLIKLELGTLIAVKDKEWAKSLYADLVSNGAVDQFLEECSLWNTEKRCWTKLLNPQGESALYEPFVNITNAILGKFVTSMSEAGESKRKAIDTNTKGLRHQEEEETTLRSRPDVSIRGEGSCFEVPEEDAKGKTAEVGFSNMTSFQEMKLEKAKGSPGLQGIQVGIYARQIFIHQPTRRFVRSLLLTETNARLYHFDRSGGMYTPEINIHKDPYTFVRLVIGLNSLDESVMGFDDSIKWSIQDGRKVGGTLTTQRKDNTKVIYNLASVDPVTTFVDICGRGTQCWSVYDPTTGDKLLVKDCWRAEDREPEYTYLEGLSGVQGVAQMMSYESNRGETKDFRETGTTSHQDFQNRIETRIVMSSYGEPIVTFKSPIELLSVLQDAMKGHMNLYMKKILHRNITIENILIGKKADGSDADPGYRGILIDLYMAIQWEGDRRNLSAEQRLNSRLYLSVVLLMCCKAEMNADQECEETVLRLPHDHLDDLEAFLYLYTYIIHVYDAQGTSHGIPAMINRWKRELTKSVAHAKLDFLRSKNPIKETFKKRWPAQCITLLEKFGRFLIPHVEKKLEILDLSSSVEAHEEVKPIMDKVVAHYETVIDLFESAIEGLTEAQELAEAGSSNSSHHHIRLCSDAPFVSIMNTRSSTKRPKRTSASDDAFKEKKKLAMPELGPVIELEGDSFARSLYQDLASDSAIDDFLRTSRFYSFPERRWKLPKVYTKLLDANYHTPFCNVVSSIVRGFWRDASREGSRKVLDTHATELQHGVEDPSTHTSRPSLVIQATGASFQLPDTEKSKPRAKIGFSNISTCIELQVEGDERPVSEQLAQAAIYARQLFMAQPNRRGAQYTPHLDFDNDPHTFVRIVLGLSSPNEEDIGLDTSIQWRIEDGRKVTGTLKTRAGDSTEKVYRLVHMVPFFDRSHIYGRGTTCWVVSDPGSGELSFVKDTWRSESGVAEHVHLQEAVGLSGVAQMVSCEPERGQTSDFRSFAHGDTGDFRNRIATRIVMKCYDRSIVHFKSAKQLLGALRDAIAGHRNLFKRGTLHRDVSPQNVLLGKPGAEPGERGILIDFDMATRCDETGFHPPIDWRIGIPLFQSTQLLYSVDFEDPQKAFAHDHVDDLESFFYILTYIVYTYDSRGNTYPRHELLREWKSYAGHNAADAKGVFLVAETDVDPIIAPRWPDALLDVFCGFRTLLADLFEDRQHARRLNPKKVLKLLEDMASNVDHHYDEVLQLFDTGIDALEKADNDSATAKVAPTNPDSASVQSPPHQSSSKRPREECADSHIPNAKRSKFSA
ncbi:hypothetical protein MD484_g5412, partial [Candolleomyces efflorescens]